MSQKWKTMYDAYNNPESVSSCPGSPMRPEYKLSVGKDGRKCLTKIRDIDMNAYINSFAPGCDMAVILNKLQAGLIPKDFDEKNCVDLSIFPKDVVDAMQKTQQFKNQFSDFSPEVQKLFNYDANLFIQSFIDGSLEDALRTLRPTDSPAELIPDPPADSPAES